MASRDDLDTAVRVAAFGFLEDLEGRYGDALPREALATGFEFRGHRVPLIGPQGIFKPAILPTIPLSFCTVPVVEGRPRPYEDETTAGGLIRYRYRGTDPGHRDNVGMRSAMQQQVPLIYLYGLVPGKYVAEWPAYVVGDDPRSLSFTVAVDDRRIVQQTAPGHVAEELTSVRRVYVTATVQQRLHQRAFRERVLDAYRRCCAICRLRHEALLEASHILSDKHPRGEPRVSNGLALCKLHHAAFDCHFLGIRPDLVVEIRADLLREEDGPMLIHGLKGCHRKPLLYVPVAPHLRPDPERLSERFETFRQASG